MRLRVLPITLNIILAMILPALPVAAQKLRVHAEKSATTIPKACESVVPASLADPIDVPALIKEANCKGAGDMMIEYSYVLNSMSTADKLREKTETTTYEVFIPTLKSGMKTRGILLVTSRNGVPVPPEELEKQRQKTGERLEKEETRIARSKSETSPAPEDPKGMLPLGMYSSISINARKGGAILVVNDFLLTCDFTLLKRTQQDGREILILDFTPRPDAKFRDHDRYIAQLTGEIWIDATDRIVTRLSGWPRSTANHSPESPAVYVEMTRVREGVWLPRVVRINGLDYQDLFDQITSDSVWTYSNYIRFSTEVKDVNVNPPPKP
jgi:hypothetical protein